MKFHANRRTTILIRVAAAMLAAGALPSVATAANFQYRHPVTGLVANPSAQLPVPSESPTIQLALGSSIPVLYANQLYSFNLGSLLTVTGDPAFSVAEVTWGVTGLPSGVLLTGATITGMVTGASNQNISVTATYKGESTTKSYAFVANAYYASCLEYLTANPGATSGSYTLDVDGAGAVAAQSYYCDMASDGGGWTKVVQQYEATPVTNWNGGVNASAFALASAKIPSHTQVAFGKDNTATFVDYVNWSYTTGDIYPAVTVVSPKTSKPYQIYRSTTGWYYNHDPELTWYTTWDSQVDARNALSLDAVGQKTGNWSFSPRYGSSYVNSRGYAMSGFVNGVSNSNAWTVWVR